MNTRQRKQRKDVKLTAEKLQTIQECLKLGMIHDDIHRVTGINRSTIATARIILVWVGRL